MTIIQLKYFLALADQLNFSKVAEEFYVTQTAISYNIKSVEMELGVQLFRRSTKKVELTEEGKIFYTRVKTAVQIIDKAQADITKGVGTLNMTIGCSELCFGPTLQETVKLFGEAHPNIKLKLTSDEPELTLMDKLVSGQLDFVIFMRTPFLRRPVNAVAKDLCSSVSRKILCSKEHPFSERKEGIPVSELVHETFVSYSNMERTRLYLPSPFNPVDTEHSIDSALIVDDFLSLMAVVRSNLGIACLPFLHDVCNDYICTIPCIEENHSMPNVSLMYMENNDSPYLQHFMEIYSDILEKAFPDSPDPS